MVLLYHPRPLTGQGCAMTPNMTTKPISIGLDFGTTNTVVSTITAEGVRQHHVFESPLGAGRSFRSLICYWQEVERARPEIHHSSGPYGISDYIEWGPDQRLIMSMKSYLGDASFTGTQIFGRRVGIEDIIVDFLTDLLGRLDIPLTGAGHRIRVGRPVVFAGARPDEALALDRLRRALEGAGLSGIEFALEPAAAGAQYARTNTRKDLVLVADFGGGTSDFSVLKDGPDGLQPIAHAGLGLAGDRFDSRIVNHVVAPYLGKGSRFKSFDTVMTVPWNSSDLVWHRISLMNNPTDLRAWDDLRRASLEPEKIERMIKIITDGTGFHLYRAVSGAKEALSQAEVATIPLGEIGLDLELELTRETFEALIADDLAQISGCVLDLLAQQQIAPERIDQVFMTGGTAHTPAVRRLFADLFGAEKIGSGGEFTSVADGLAELAHAAA